MTFVVVGGGFSGVETVGEINDFVKESVEKFYRNMFQQLTKYYQKLVILGCMPRNP
jgi:NADH dehydrogenase